MGADLWTHGSNCNCSESVHTRIIFTRTRTCGNTVNSPLPQSPPAPSCPNPSSPFPFPTPARALGPASPTLEQEVTAPPQTALPALGTVLPVLGLCSLGWPAGGCPLLLPLPQVQEVATQPRKQPLGECPLVSLKLH